MTTGHEEQKDVVCLKYVQGYNEKSKKTKRGRQVYERKKIGKKKI